MTARSPSALLLSATLHAVLVGLILLFTYALETQVKDQPKVFELVAGEGDDYAATQAPALGVQGGVKLTLPEPAAPVLTPPAQAASPPAESAPEPQVTPAPVQKPVTQTPPKSTASKTPDFSQQIKRKIIRAESKAKLEIKKEREAEQKRLTKEEFDRQNKAARAAAAGGNPNVKHIDAEGIAGGVVGGSASSKSGAGGKALTREEGELMDAYFALVKRRMQENLDKPPGLSDSLTAVAEFRLGADGSVSGAQITRSSGSAEFDQAVLDAISRFRSIGARPDHKGETVNLTFRMKEEDGG
jgi:colicin import membrane protein